MEGRVIALEMGHREMRRDLESDRSARKEKDGDVETRLRRLERGMWMACGAMSLLQVVLKLLK